MATKLNWKEIKSIKQDIYKLEKDLVEFADGVCIYSPRPRYPVITKLTSNSQLAKIKERLKYEPDNEQVLAKKALFETTIEEFTKEVATQKALLPEEELKPVEEKKPKPKAEPLKVGEMVLAKRNDTDERMVTAKIISISGHGNNLIYQVRFKDKFLTQKHAADTRPATKANEDIARKRKIQEEEDSRKVVLSNDPNVISAEPQIRKDALAADGSLRPAKIPRKLGSEKKLEKARNSWQNFNKGKTGQKKESQFRLGDGYNARVGVTGSGKGMTADVKRQRHKHEEIEEE